MINCPKCGEDNQVGAIFCRGCGEKLELDDLRPDDLKSKTKASAGKTIATVGRNLILLILIGGGIVGGVMAFLKPALSTPPGLNEEETKVALKRFRKLRKGKPGTEYLFNVSEVNMLAELVLELTDDARMAAHEKRIAEGVSQKLVVEGIFIECLPPTDMRFVLECRVMGKLNFYPSVSGTVTGTPNGLTFRINQVHAGKLPIPTPQLQEPLIKIFTGVIEQNVNFKNEIQFKITEITIDSDKLTVRKKPADEN